MKTTFICMVLGAACSMPGASFARTAEGHVKVHISMAAPEALELTYEMPADCARLPLQKHNPGYQAIRANWQSLDACGTVEEGVLTRGQKACRQIRFRVPVSTDKVVGYPGAFPIGEAIYAHTSKYAVTAACGSVSYLFSAPGSVGLQGKIHRARATAEGDGADLAALLMPRDLPQSEGVLAYYDPKLSAQSVAQIKATLDGTVAFYRKALPDAHFSMPIVAAGLASAPGGPTIGGDAADIMRFTLFNWPAQPQPQEQRLLTTLVAHEISHRFQLRDAVDGYLNARLIHEGGGEFLRWMVSVRRGWLTPAQAGQELDEKLADCMLGVGQRGWGELSRGEAASNYYDYSCGLPAYVYSLAARQGKGSALMRINDFYRDLRLGARPGFEHALECGSKADCTPRWLPQLLGKSAPMAAGWSNMLGETGLATMAPLTRYQSDAMMRNALVQLIKDDCGGESSTTPTADGMIVDSLKGCKSVRKEAYVTRVEGLPVFGSGRTLSAMAAACSRRGQVSLGLKDGSMLEVSCTRQYAARARFFKADIERVLGLLGREAITIRGK